MWAVGLFVLKSRDGPCSACDGKMVPHCVAIACVSIAQQSMIPGARQDAAEQPSVSSSRGVFRSAASAGPSCGRFFQFLCRARLD